MEIKNNRHHFLCQFYIISKVSATLRKYLVSWEFKVIILFYNLDFSSNIEVFFNICEFSYLLLSLYQFPKFYSLYIWLHVIYRDFFFNSVCLFFMVTSVGIVSSIWFSKSPIFYPYVYLQYVCWNMCVVSLVSWGAIRSTFLN